jgi:hypothetical protein
MRLSRDLFMCGITYKLQKRPLSGLSKSIMRKLVWPLFVLTGSQLDQERRLIHVSDVTEPEEQQDRARQY